MDLTYLSLQRAPRLHKQMPYTPTNAERYRDFRVAMAQRVERIGNEYRFPFHGGHPAANPPPNSPEPGGRHLSDGEEYARDACADGSPDVIQNYADRRGV